MWIAAFLFLQAPEASFISEFRKALRSDDELLQNYSYTEKETRTETDRNGKPKSTEVNIYQISPDGGQLYRRLVSKNGVPPTPGQEMKTPIGPPRRLDIQKSQRVLLKGVHMHEVHEYSEHRKF